MLDPDMPLRAAAGSDTAVAFALFEHIAARDPDSVATKDDAIAVFRECMEAVGHRARASAMSRGRSGWVRISWEIKEVIRRNSAFGSRRDLDQCTCPRAPCTLGISFNIPPMRRADQAGEGRVADAMQIEVSL